MKDVEYDPYTGIRTTLTYNDDYTVKVVRSYDPTAVNKWAATLREHDSTVKKETWSHYAIIPAFVQVEMYTKGIDWSRDPKEAVKFINQHHPELKVTNLWHEDRRAKIRDPRRVVK